MVHENLTGTAVVDDKMSLYFSVHGGWCYLSALDLKREDATQPYSPPTEAH